MTAAKPKDVEKYFATLSKGQQGALEKVRTMIRAAAPEAEEGISYGVPAFRHKGKPLAGYAAFAKHCSYFPFSPAVIAANKNELTSYVTAKGTVSFPAEKPIAAGLVKKLVQARMQEIDRK